MKLEVQVSEIQNAATKIASQNEAFRDTLANLKNAHTTLSESWTGTRHDEFETQMQEQFAWYEKMANLVDDYVTMMKNAAAKYTEADNRAAAAIRKK